MLLKPLTNPSLLISNEQYYTQTLHREGKLMPEQCPGEINPLFQTVINPQPHILHEKTSRALACSPDTTPAKPHLTSNIQQTKVRTVQFQIHDTNEH